jgi:hypothetical protein
MQKIQTKQLYKNLYYCKACGKVFLRYSIARDHLQLFHPEVYFRKDKDWKEYIVLFKRLEYQHFLNLKKNIRLIKTVKGKVKYPLRIFI